jgi:hypothetical protein
MNETSRKNGIKFLVAVIPTKEMVFSDDLERDSKFPRRDVVDRLLASERLARERTFAFFTDSDISYVDTLPALKQARTNQLYTRNVGDMHPGRNGYRVIAEAVATTLKPR